MKNIGIGIGPRKPDRSSSSFWYTYNFVRYTQINTVVVPTLGFSLGSGVTIFQLDFLNSFASGMFQAYCAKTTGLHLTLHSAESGGELFKGLKDLASLVVCSEKNFWLGVVDFM